MSPSLYPSFILHLAKIVWWFLCDGRVEHLVFHQRFMSLPTSPTPNTIVPVLWGPVKIKTEHVWCCIPSSCRYVNRDFAVIPHSTDCLCRLQCMLLPARWSCPSQAKLWRPATPWPTPISSSWMRGSTPCQLVSPSRPCCWSSHAQMANGFVDR